MLVKKTGIRYKKRYTDYFNKTKHP